MNPLEELFLNNPMGELATDDTQLQSPYLPEDEGLSFLTPIHELASEETESKTSSVQGPFLDNYGDNYHSHMDKLEIRVPSLEKQHMKELQKKYPPLIDFDSVNRKISTNNIKSVDLKTSDIKRDPDYINYLNIKINTQESKKVLVKPSLPKTDKIIDFFNRDTRILITDLKSTTMDEFYSKFSPISVTMPKNTEIVTPLQLLADYKREDYNNDYIDINKSYEPTKEEEKDDRVYVKVPDSKNDKENYRKDIDVKPIEDPHANYIVMTQYESKSNSKQDYKEINEDYYEEPFELKHPENYESPILNPDSEEKNFLKDDTGKPSIFLVNTVKSSTSVRKEAWQTVETTDKIQATDITPSSNFDKTIGDTMSPSIERKIGEETVKIPARKVAWEKVEHLDVIQATDITPSSNFDPLIGNTIGTGLVHVLNGSGDDYDITKREAAWLFVNSRGKHKKISLDGGNDQFDATKNKGFSFDALEFYTDTEPKKISLDGGNDQFDATKNTGFAQHGSSKEYQDPYFDSTSRNPFVEFPEDVKNTFMVSMPKAAIKKYQDATDTEKLMWQGYQILQSMRSSIPEFIVTRPMMNWYKGQTLYTGIEYLNDTMVLADANYMIGYQALASAPLDTANVTHGYNYTEDLRTFQSDEEKRKAFRGLESVRNLRTASGDPVDFGTDFYWNIFFDYPEENKAHLPRFPYSGWMPVMSYQLNGVKSKTIEQETMLGSIVVPMLYELPSSIDITLPETCHMDVDHWLRSYFAAIYGSEEIHSIMALDKRKVKIRPYKQQCLYIKLAWYTQQWNIIRTRKFICIPNFDFTYKGDESVALKTISLTFNIVGSDGLDHVPVQFAMGSRDIGNTSVADSAEAHMGPLGATVTMAKNLASAFSPGEIHRTMDIQQRTSKDLLIRG